LARQSRWWWLADSICHGDVEVASHPETIGRRQRVSVARHFAGIGRRAAKSGEPVAQAPTIAEPELLRPLSEYERVVGGEW
jgi:hypothetical protein